MADSLSLTDLAHVSSWTDSSGNGNTATQATDARRPLYRTGLTPTGLPALQFQGSNWMGAPTAADAATQTYAAVVWLIAGDINPRSIVAGSTTANGLHWYVNSTHKPELTKQAAALVGTSTTVLPVSPSTPNFSAGYWSVVFVEHVNATSYRFELNGAAAGNGSHAVTLSGGGTTHLGGSGTDGQYFFNGLIGEIVRWNRVLTSTERADVQAELTGKWITGSTASPVSVSAPALAVTDAVPTPTVTAGTRITVAAPALAMAAALLAPTVSAGTSVRVDAPTLAVSTSVPAPAVVIATGVNVAAPVLGASAAVPAPSVVAGAKVTVAAPALGVTLGLPAPTVTITVPGISVAAPHLSLITAMPEVGVVGPLPAETIVTAGIPTPDEIGVLVPLVPDTELDFAVPITRTSVLAPALSAEYPAHPEQGAEGAPDVVRADVGYLHLWIGGQDVTYWRGGMTVIRSWESQAPFGDTVAAFEFPQRNPWDVDGEGDLSFLRPDAPVVLGIVKDGVTRQVWRGFLDAAGSGLGEGEDYTYEAKGTFWQAQSRIREPHSIVEPVDIGVWIARVLNASEGRHWRTMPLTPIGITTMTRGARDQYDMEYVQELLSEAVTDDLRQWTLSEVLPGVPRLVLKPAPSTVHATVAYGTPGVDVDLRVDQSTRWDRVFLRGIGPQGGGWAHIFYPHLELLNAPAYPMAGFANMDLGTTDADTTSGTGVTDWQRRVDEIRGFANPPVSGVMSAAWVAVIDDLQRRIGAAPDGSLGPQTWNATFDRGIPDAEALTPRRLPMASKPTANKWLYSAAGVRLGPNPDFDRSLIVRDVAVDVGPGKTKADGFKLARKWLARYGTAAANGTITFTLDPNETDRTTLSHLSNVKVLGYQGTDRVLQVASKSVDLEQGDAGPTYVVTCRVDERARDAMAVEDLLEQRRNAQPDPSRNPVNRNRASRAVTDQRIPWDSESPCGVLRRTAVNGASGLWTVVTVPFAEVGKLAGIRLTSTQPFALALFASLRITENKLASIVGNPFGTSDKWRDAKDLLDEYGIIEAWGEPDQACGYSPKTEGDGAAFTGDFILDTPVDYWTETPPYVSVAIYMRGGSGWISGNFLPAYES